jgi:GH15 family glucan-1,4-alpha-glucosidase
MEAHRFMGWVADRCKESDPTKGGLQIMYGPDGRRKLTEEILEHLSGYKNSRPVRIGNAAYKQLQLDIYGELMDAVYLYNKYGRTISYEQWTYLRELMNWLCKNWQEPDDGLWEVRSGKQRFVYSRFMTWVALDRAVRLAHHRGLPADTDLWEKTRSQVYEEVITKGYSEKEKCFVQYYGSDTVDACNLLMPIVKFVGPDDPLFTSTLDKIVEELTFDSLVYRYNFAKGATDGLTGREGTFSLCSFWLVEALTLWAAERSPAQAGEDVQSCQWCLHYQARLVQGSPSSPRLDPDYIDQLAHHFVMFEQVFEAAADFDLVHLYIDYLHFPLYKN